MSGRILPSAPLAIVGMACRFPGADNLDEFWSLVREGRSGIVPLPADRLDRELYFDSEQGIPGKTYCDLGGVVPHRPIDRQICPLDDEFIQRYDISHLTLCEVVATACRDAGYDPLALPYQNSGVFVGNSSGGSELDYQLAYHSYAREMAESLRSIAASASISTETRETAIAQIIESIRRAYPNRDDCRTDRLTAHSAAALMIEVFGLSGPAVVTDAACASSLMALQLAAAPLREGRIDMAIVAGAAFRKTCEWVAIAQARSMSSRGCAPFDAKADGLISSDGYGAVVVKTLERAMTDGDRILGVVRGIGLSSDGRGKGFWAPRKEGQIEAIRRAYEGGIDPARLQYLEAHATSTQLGDATEVAALSEAFAGTFAQKIPITSVKANIGHTLESAGIASLIKTLLAMRHGLVPPAANFDTPSSEVDWDQVPFYVPQTAVEWPAGADGHPRRAGIDSFGIGGINLHVVVDEGPYATEREHYSDSPTDGRSQAISTTRPDEPIAVIGMGAVFAGAPTFDLFEKMLLSGEDPKQAVPIDRWNTQIECQRLRIDPGEERRLLGGFITNWEFDWRKFKVPPKQLEAANPLQFLLLDAAAQALADGGYEEKPFDRSRVGAVVGTIFQSDYIVDIWHGVWLTDFLKRLQHLLRKRGLSEEIIAHIGQDFTTDLLTRKPALRDETASGSSSTLASRITKQFDLMGGAMSIDAGDASSTAAIEAAVDLLRTGACDMILCAAGQQCMSRIGYEELASENLFSLGEPHAPFDSEAGGTVPGEGAGVVLLKRLADARRDGDSVRAVIRSVAVASDTASSERALRTAMRCALQSAGIEAEQVSLVETNVANRVQSVALENALVDTHNPSSRRDPLLLGSLTAQFGNTRGAGGMAALLKTVLALEQGQAPATFGLTNPAGSISIRRKAFDPLLNPQQIPLTTANHTAIAAVNSLNRRGFLTRGGTAYHLLIEAEPNPAKSSSAPRAQLQEPNKSLSEPTPSLPKPGEHVDPPPVVQPRRQTTSSLKKRELSRFILRSVETPLPAGETSPPTFSGSVVILGANKAAAALRDRLVELGATVYELAVQNDLASSVALLDQIWQQGPIRHLFLMTAQDDEAPCAVDDRATWNQRLTAGIQTPFLVCQRWYELLEMAGLLEGSSLIASTALGGDFGFGGHSSSIEGGGLAGLLKSIDVESRGQLQVKVIDTPANEPAKMIAREICAELSAGSTEVEVGYIRGRRQSVRAISEPTDHLPPREIPNGGVWVVTGGAREIICKIASELGKRFGLKLHLLDSTSPDEIAAQLESCRQTGAAVTYHVCDLSDRRSLAAVLDQIRAADGPLNGLIHAAGHQISGRLERKNLDNATRMWETIPGGAAALMELTQHDPLKFFVALGSTGGRFGGYAQTDYSLAHEMMAKLVNNYRDRRPDCASLTIHWPAWDETGASVSDPANPTLSKIDVVQNDPAEAAALLIDELQADSRDSEILIVDHPGGAHSDHPSMPSEPQIQQQARRRQLIAAAPVIDYVYSEGTESGVAGAMFDPAIDPFLTAHRQDGTPLLPAVMGIELFAEAAHLISDGRQPVELRDFQLLNGMRMAVDKPHQATIHLTLDGDLATGRMNGDFRDRQGRLTDPQRQYQTCTIQLSESGRQITPPDFGPPPSEWTEEIYSEHGQQIGETVQNAVIYGPQLHAQKAMYFDGNSAWGRLVAPPLAELGGNRPGRGWCTPPALLDAVLSGCGFLAKHLLGTEQLPHVFERIEFGRLPRDGEECFSRIFFQGREERHLIFEFWLIGDDGTVIAHSTGCRFVDLNISLQNAVSSNPA